ncbi:hypothetical protein HpHA229_03860 [Helicobacter pylori]
MIYKAIITLLRKNNSKNETIFHKILKDKDKIKIGKKILATRLVLSLARYTKGYKKY